MEGFNGLGSPFFFIEILFLITFCIKGAVPDDSFKGNFVNNHSIYQTYWNPEVIEALEVLGKGEWKHKKLIQVTIVSSSEEVPLLQNFLCSQNNFKENPPMLVLSLDDVCGKIPVLKAGSSQVQCLENYSSVPKTAMAKHFMQVMIAITLLQLGFSILYLDVGTVFTSDDFWPQVQEMQLFDETEKDLLVLMGSSVSTISAADFDVFWSRDTPTSLSYWKNLEKRFLEAVATTDQLPINSIIEESLTNVGSWGFFQDLMFHSGHSFLNPRSPALERARQESGQKLLLVKPSPLYSNTIGEFPKETYLRAFDLWAMTTLGACRSIPDGGHHLPASSYQLEETISYCTRTLFEDGSHTQARWKHLNQSSLLTPHPSQINVDLSLEDRSMYANAQLHFSAKDLGTQELQAYLANNPMEFEVIADIGMEGELSSLLDESNIETHVQSNDVLVNITLSSYLGNLVHLFYEPAALELRIKDQKTGNMMFLLQACKLSSKKLLHLNIQLESFKKEPLSSQRIQRYSNFTEQEIDMGRRARRNAAEDAYEVLTTPEYIRAIPETERRSRFDSELFALPRILFRVLKNGFKEVRRASTRVALHVGKTLQQMRNHVEAAMQ
mmetsp:Transcript_33905/g.44725  ORF Transcript_33905/g.44725 Transcript_33905/m.44725 type:complete len:611 (-) Transcript_33905:182-2014(-)